MADTADARSRGTGGRPGRLSPGVIRIGMFLLYLVLGLCPKKDTKGWSE